MLFRLRGYHFQLLLAVADPAPPWPGGGVKGLILPIFTEMGQKYLFMEFFGSVPGGGGRTPPPQPP